LRKAACSRKIAAGVVFVFLATTVPWGQAQEATLNFVPAQTTVNFTLGDILHTLRSRLVLPLFPLVASTTISPLIALVVGMKRTWPDFRLKLPCTVGDDEVDPQAPMVGLEFDLRWHGDLVLGAVDAKHAVDVSGE
jgi:hypothetical protein